MPGDPSNNDPSYKGPNQSYQPELGEAKVGTKKHVPKRQGYHDEDLLRRNLKSIKTRCNALIDASERKLRSNYTLTIQQGTKLAEAHEKEWPSSMEETPSQYISYDEYRVMRAKPSRGADYIMKTYEDSVRGPAGTNALDIIHGVEPLKNEAETIEAFLDKYLGDVNDSAEYRTLELLQDWTFSALKITGRFRDVYQAENSKSSKIPDAELVNLSPDDAKEYQTLFKVKANVANNEISQILKDFDKDYTKMSGIYFDRFLGPALDFRLKAGRGLELKQGKDSFLASQALSATTALNTSFEGTLADQLRRNMVFSQKMDALFERVIARDNYTGMIKSLEVKGKAIKNPFSNVSPTAEQVEAFRSEYQTIAVDKEERNVFRSSHLSLDDADKPEAHPWAISRWGDVLEGEYFFDVDSATPAMTTNSGPDGEALPFDGMRPGGPTSHRHLGVDVDGTRQILGDQGIEYGTLITPTINKDESVPVPLNLRVLEHSVCIDTGSPVVNTKIAWDSKPDENWEIQLVPYCTPLPPFDCLRGHELDYPVPTCEPWTAEKIYLNTGQDTSYYDGNEILSPAGSAGYVVSSSFSIPIDDQYFLVGYDSSDGQDLMVSVCERSLLTLDYEKMAASETVIATNTTETQKFVCATQLNQTDFLVGCVHNDRPSLVLIRVDTLTGDIEIVTSEPVLLTSVLIEEQWGISSIDSFDSGTKFIIGYALDELDETSEFTNFAYINCGQVKIPPGGTTRDLIQINPNTAEAISSGFSTSYNISVKMLNDRKGIVIWDENEDDLTDPFYRGYWGKGFSVDSSVTISDFSELTNIATNVSGHVVIEKLLDDKFISLYALEATYYPNPNFLDVTTGHPFYDDIAWMAYEEITTGYSDNTFRPSRQMNRMQTAAFLYRVWVQSGSDGDDPVSFPDPGFSDVDITHTFYTEISWMAYYEITTGFDDGTFRPQNYTTRQAFAAFLYRMWPLMGKTYPDTVPNPGFSDVTEANPFYDEIAWLAYMEITTGFSDGTFRPSSNITRQAAAAFLHRFWVALGLEESFSSCEGVINPKLLIAQCFTVDDDLVVTETFTDRTHTVDASLNTNAPAISLSSWDNDKQFLVVWGSQFDQPNEEVTARGKAAIMLYDAEEDDGIIQETFDLPINIPPQTDYSRMTPVRMGDSDYFMIAASGSETSGPTKINLGSDEDDNTDDTLYETIYGADAIRYVDWPSVGTETVVLPTGSDGQNDGSAVLLADDRIMYAYYEADEIKIGYANDIETFLTNNDSLKDTVTQFTGLTNPHVTIFRNPTDDNIYLIMGCSAMDPGTLYGTGSTAGNAVYPWQIIYRSEDEGDTWVEHSVLESPIAALDQFSWSNNTGNNWGSAAADRVTGIPYISGTTWVLPAPNYSRDGTPSKIPRPGIWRSTDAGLTWALVFDQDGHSSDEDNGAGSRNLVKYSGTYFWAAGDPSDVMGLSTAYYVSSNETAWSVGADSEYTASPAWTPRTPAFFIAPYENEDSLWVIRENGVIAVYPSDQDLPVDTGAPPEPFDFNGITETSYTELYDYDFGSSTADLVVTMLGDYYVFMQDGYVMGVELVEKNFHLGVAAFIVDKCSAETGPKT